MIIGNTGSAVAVPVESFTFIKVEKILTLEDCEEDCEVASYGITASGVVLTHFTDNKTYILTAGHVCDAVDMIPPDIFYAFKERGESILVKPVIEVFDYSGTSHAASIYSISMHNDLCLLVSDDNWTDGVYLADEMPLRGERVFNTAAPSGMYSPYNVLIFEGFYTGFDRSNDYYFTVPARPGSSGSPILDQNGDLIGVVHSASRTFENVGISSGLDDISYFLLESGLVIP